MFSSLSDYLDQLLEAICVVDENGKFLYLSSGFKRILGYEIQELLGRSMLEFVHPDDRERTLKAAREIMADGAKVDFENRYLRKDGQIVDIQWCAQWNATDKVRIAVARDVTKHKEQLSLLQNLAFYDQLTQLPNRALCSDRLRQAFARARREQTQLALLFVDLDKLKYVNDTEGHQAGDRLLLRTAHCLSGCVRDSDTVSRFGGDEFVVILDEIEDEDKALMIANKILSQLRTPPASSLPTAAADSYVIQASIGVATYPKHARDEHSLLAAADRAMYLAKRLGGDRIQLAQDATLGILDNL
ncbi:sensor domain-containing diguanylate cyclase [Shewanella sp. AS16]|uniref:sensor domain-containing protein n=1 Tax=Shewanella sp. AS16 TaxID=2907625 RepID=UPI001F1E6B35|nr:sensor domain-containing diguanylate cyclase [Shewanella sp. AS16]MCE9686441.1 sensor domain-containing diguanylate cyclase [Shewanella sp. AS16]